MKSYRTFNECVELLMFHFVALHVDLQSQQQSKKKLVFFVQAPCCIVVHLKGHELYDARDPFDGNRTFWGPVPVENYNTNVIFER